MQTTITFSARRLDWFLRFVLAAAAIAVFWPVVRAGFVNWDDERNIVNNPHLGLAWENIKWMFTDTDYVRRYLPLGWLSYTLDRVLFGGSAASYHAGNLLLHVTNTLLLYAIIKCVLQRFQTGAEGPFLTVRLAAFAGALWWAINPLRAEPVAWASSRIYCAAGLFFFLSILAYLRKAQPGLSSAQQRRAVWAAAICFALSLFIYPVALGGFVIFVALDFLPRPPMPLESPARRAWAEKLLFVVPIAIMFGVNFSARLNHPNIEPVVTFARFSASARLFQAFWTWSWYLWKPWQPFDLAPKYPDLLTDMPFTAAHIAAALLVVGITVLLFLRRRVWPGLAALWLCHLALLAPLTGVTEHPHYTFDRYSYIVGGVWALALGGIVLRLAARERLRVTVATAMTLLCCFFGFLARQQSLIWNNSLILQSRIAQSLGNHPQRASHEVVIAALLLEANRPAEAQLSLRRATALQPELPEAWGAFGDALAAQNRVDEAIAGYQHALALNPQLTSSRQNLAVTLAVAGRQEEAIQQFRELLRLNPLDPSAHHNLALSLHQLGQEEEAAKHLKEFRRLQEPHAKTPQ